MSPPRRVHHADATSGVQLAGLGVGDALDLRIQAVGVVHQGHFADAFGVQLPEREGLAVGAPAEAVLHGELLLVDPVEGPMDEVFVGRVGEGGDLAGTQVLHVEVALAHIGHAGAIGRELGELQARGRGVAAELEQFVAGAIEHPVVAPGVGAPDLLAVGVDEHLGAVFAPGVVIHRQGLGLAGRNPFRGGQQDVALVGGRVVPNQVLTGTTARRLLPGDIAGAVVQPMAAKALPAEFAALEDPLHRQQRARGVRLSGEGRRQEGRRRQ